MLFDKNGDHPRTCGEKKKREQKNRSIQGSPPHMRGKVTKAGKVRTAPGITPAHAGKSMKGGEKSGGF